MNGGWLEWSRENFRYTSNTNPRAEEHGKANENFIYDRFESAVSDYALLGCQAVCYNNCELKFNLPKLKLYNRLLLHLLAQIFQLQN